MPDEPPPIEDHPLLRLLQVQQGVISRRQAHHYLPAKTVERRVAARRWRVAARGVYVAQDGPPSTEQLRWVALLAAGWDREARGGCAPACLAGVTALQVAGLRGIKARTLDVLVPHFRQATAPPGATFHRTRAMPDDDVARVFRPPATLPGTSLVDAARWARSDDEARLIVAASFQQRIVSLADVEQALAARPNARRCDLVRCTAWDSAGGSHSLAELDFVELCRRYGLPTPTRQARHQDRLGRTRFLDVVFEPWRVAVEIDGAHHLDVRQLWDDAQRQNSVGLAGYVVLRYPAYVVREHPARVATEIREALWRAGWRP